ncbi:MAG: winged helix-turn-helix domain-containing protein [Myxococcales bacterium]
MSEPAIALTTASLEGDANPPLAQPPRPIELDQRARTVSVDGRLIPLTPREYSLLSFFHEHAGRLLTRQHLVREVWGERYGGGPRTVDIHVSRLRRKLGPGLPLTTLRRMGYRFGEPMAHGGTIPHHDTGRLRAQRRPKEG